MGKEAAIQFEAFRIKQLSYESSDLELDNRLAKDGDLLIHAQIGTGKEKEELGQTSIRFDIKYLRDAQKKENNGFVMNLEVEGLFKFTGDYEEKEKEEFLRCNGSAILFPYIRSLVTNVSGFDTNENQVVLPTFNIIAMVEDAASSEDK